MFVINSFNLVSQQFLQNLFHPDFYYFWKIQICILCLYEVLKVHFIQGLCYLQVSNEEAKSVEISKLQKMLGSLNLELDAAKLATINECNKNAVLQNQFDLSMKEKSALERELVAVADLKKENTFLRVSPFMFNDIANVKFWRSI